MIYMYETPNELVKTIHMFVHCIVCICLIISSHLSRWKPIFILFNGSVGLTFFAGAWVPLVWVTKLPWQNARTILVTMLIPYRHTKFIIYYTKYRSNASIFGSRVDCIMFAIWLRGLRDKMLSTGLAKGTKIRIYTTGFNFVKRSSSVLYIF